MGLLVLSGCGYAFRGGVVNLPPGAHSLTIPVFANNTSEAGIETTFTNDLTFEFNRSKALRVSAPPADLVLSGAIDQILVEPVAYSQSVVAVERRVVLKVSAKLTETATGAIIWEDRGIIDNEVFSVAGDPSTTERNRRDAIVRIAERVASQIHNRALEGF